MRLVRYFLLGLVMSLTTFSARADLTGSTVTGTFIEGTNAGNFFDPTITTNVIPDGYENVNGTAVVIEPGQQQFGAELGCWRACNTITAVFTDTQLDIQTQAGFWFNDTFHFQFEDTAFTGISEVSNTYSNFSGTPSASYGISGDIISVDITLTGYADEVYDAVFNISSDPSSWISDPPVPEPSSYLWLAAGLASLAAAPHRSSLLVILRRLF